MWGYTLHFRWGFKDLNRNQVGEYEFNRLKKAYKIADQKLDAQYKLLMSWNNVWQRLMLMTPAEADVTEFNKIKYGREIKVIEMDMESFSTDKSSEECRKLQ